MIKKKIAIYCRVSTEDQDGNFSIQEQLSRGEAWAKASGYEYTLYSDTFTGTKLDRPAISQFFNNITDFTGIWVIEFTRLTRNVIDAYKLLEILKSNNIDTFIDGELRNINKPEEYLTFGVNAVIADYERLRIRERFTRAVKKKKQTGGYWAPVSLYGYETFYNEQGERKVRIVPAEAEIIRYMFNQVAEHGTPLNDLSRELNRRGIPTKQDGQKGWQSAYVGKYMRKTLYAGYYIYDGKEVISNDFPPIISRAIFDKVQITINARTSTHKARYTAHGSTGIVECHYCKAKVMFNTKQERRKGGYIPTDYYLIKHENTCQRDKGNSVSSFTPPAVFDLIIAINFVQFALDRESLLSYYEQERTRYAQEEEKINADITRLEVSISETVKSKQKAIKLYTAIDGDNEIMEEIKALSAVQKEKESKLLELQQSLYKDSERLNTILGKISVDLLHEFIDGSPVQRRRLLNSLTSKAVIKDNALRWKWITGKITGIPDLKLFVRTLKIMLKAHLIGEVDTLPIEAITALIDAPEGTDRTGKEVDLARQILTDIFLMEAKK